MKKSNDRSTNIVVILLVIIFLLLVLVGIKSRQVDKLDHYIACEKTCFPKRVDTDKSRVFCNCLENENDEQ